jgi:hypothetical protein
MDITRYQSRNYNSVACDSTRTVESYLTAIECPCCHVSIPSYTPVLNAQVGNVNRQVEHLPSLRRDVVFEQGGEGLETLNEPHLR